MRLSENIYNFRKLKGLTMEELGKMVGVSKQTIKRYETEEIKNIPYDTIISLAKSLGVTPAELMGFDNKQELSEDNELIVAHAKMLKKYATLPKNVQNDISAIIDDLYNIYSSKK